LEIVFLLVFALAVAGIVFGAIHAERRRKELRAWARSERMSFRPRPDRSIDDRFPGFSCFRRGEDRYGFNIMRGVRDGRAAWGMDYHYETESRDSDGDRTTTDHYFSAVVLEVDLPLRPLSIRPEGFFDKVAEFLGFDDIDFESAEFSRTFHVRSPDRRWAFDVIQQETMEFLLACPRFTIELAEGTALARRESRFDAADFADAFRVIEGILDRLPGFLLRELRGEAR
jgi:hypothetical protein